MLLHSFFKQNIISVKQGDNAVFIMSNEADTEKINNFIINSYITSRRVKNIEIKKVEPMTKLKINQTIYEIK